MRLALRAFGTSKPGSWRLSCSRAYSTATAPESSTAARLRFAPSPTGSLHLGGLRTALFNHLLARKLGGKWILRVEDTDQSRLVPGSVGVLKRTLGWAGLDYDEGVGRSGGKHGPYTQSERLDLYRHHAQELIDSGHAYECFCSPDDLEAIRASLQQQGHYHGYDGRCRHLSRDDVQQRKRAGHKYVVRFKSQAEKEKLPEDLIFGAAQPTTVSTGADDFIIMKADGWPTYHLASVVDDHLMEISHVLRGELYRAFGWKPPQFAHLPLLMGLDGTKLSKRTGDVSVENYRDKGYEPEALVNFLGLMGWDYQTALENAAAEGDEITDGLLPFHARGDDHSLFELFTLPQMIQAFDLSLVTHRRAAVNLGKLDFLNKMHLRRKAGRLGADGELVNVGKAVDSAENEKGREELVKRYQKSLKKLPALKDNSLVDDLEYVGDVFDIELARVVKLCDMAEKSIFFYVKPQYDSPESDKFLAELGLATYVDGLSLVVEELEWRIERYRHFDVDLCWEAMHATIAKLGIRKKSALMLPMRHALTGIKTGPSVPQIMSVLGPERSLDRLRAGRAFASARGRA
ncbi:Glutamate--tRNA ligase [Vanrija pseudolonga]|uniref:Glutamate--tRNA ligase, mitochondrial n=1 Tax=Vanrija pseudolonga TaxID=143232 RepID=A0AAF0YF51_9TREE|nr:Glutamate--tRNA ligase [Vanrija pseudolonga]